MPSPALPPWSDSGGNRIVAPFDPPELSLLSYDPAQCHARRMKNGPAIWHHGGIAWMGVRQGEAPNTSGIRWLQSVRSRADVLHPQHESTCLWQDVRMHTVIRVILEQRLDFSADSIPLTTDLGLAEEPVEWGSLD